MAGPSLEVIMHPTDWQDQWIAENYPHAVFFVDDSGEVGVMLGFDENDKECW